MAKCDVCGKNSLLPEKFGATNICKICFMKANGPFWKHTYDRRDEAEKQHKKAMDAAHKQNFPDHVTTAIDDFFMTQINAMKVCACCGEPVSQVKSIGKTNLCDECFDKIDNSAWNEAEYDDNDQVEANRKKVLKIATKKGFPQIVIDDINAHFDNRLLRGLLCSIKGGCEQTLKVFETYAVLSTTVDFDADEMAEAYGAALQSTQPKENLISNSTAKSLARSVMSGGIVRAGINFATSVAIDAAADKMAPEKAMFKVVQGNFKIDYHIYDYAEYQKCGSNDVGFIRFVSNRARGRQNEDILFFFDDDSKKIDEAYNVLCECIADTCNQPVAQPQPAVQAQSAAQVSVADELLKFKQLLDMGAITQEEFDAKKRELLSLK